jgi:hypothetical protein
MSSIRLAGRDVTADWLPRLEAAAEARGPALADEARRQAPVAALREASSPSLELDRWLALLKAHAAAGTGDFAVPARPGAAGRLLAAFKRALWKLLRYQHERIAVQQNAVNLQLVLALEAVLEEQRRELAALRARLAALEPKSQKGDEP